jgi:hypothetical protein
MLTSLEIRLLAGVLALVLLGWTVKSCRSRPVVEQVPTASEASSNQ